MDTKLFSRGNKCETRAGYFPVSTKVQNSKVDSKDGTLDIKDGKDGYDIIGIKWNSEWGIDAYVPRNERLGWDTARK